MSKGRVRWITEHMWGNVIYHYSIGAYLSRNRSGYEVK